MRRRHIFSATKILDLEFHVIFFGSATGKHALDLKVYTPQGHLYQNISTPIVLGPPDEQNTESGPVRSAWRKRRRKKFQKVTVRFPVAGTSIVTHSLYGRWRVEAFLDHERAACSRPRAFYIRQ